MKGKLNIFQRTMLLWNEIHPYNAVHVLRVQHPLNEERLRNIINNHLQESGLKGLHIDRIKKTFHYHRDTADIEIRIIEATQEPLLRLSSEIQKQLNTPFTGGKRINPLRFFIFREDNSFYLGLVYFHLISGGDSIIALLKSIVKSYMDRNYTNLYVPETLYPRGYSHLFRINIKNILAWLFTIPEHVSALRHAFRPGYADINDQNNGFFFFCIKPPRFNSLIKTANKWGVTLNDMFLAMLLKSLSPLAFKRNAAVRRKNISVASIVNIRKDLSVDAPEIFGLFLSSFSVSHQVPEGIRLEQLVKDISEQTKRIKKYKLYFRTVMEMGLSLLLISFFFKKRQKKFYSKYYPLWGGITNINLNALWERADDCITTDYYRAVSTGPATPIVFSFTTVNDVLNIGVSFRTTVFSQAEVEKIVENFSYCLSDPEGGPE